MMSSFRIEIEYEKALLNFNISISIWNAIPKHSNEIQYLKRHNRQSIDFNINVGLDLPFTEKKTYFMMESDVLAFHRNV